jgi:hypothetical protein
MEPVYIERIVAFIDILGFRNLVHQIGADSMLHGKLHAALSRIKHYKLSSVAGNTAQSDLDLSVFSDSVAISGAADNLQGVLWTVIHLQSDLLNFGVLVRGGVSRGRTVHTDDMLYGEGMLAAYDLESKAAVYPRIVIDPKLVDNLTPRYRATFLDEDQDGLWFINPFTVGIQPGGMSALVEDGWDPYEVSLRSLGRVIDQELLTLRDVGQLAKWGWLKNQHSAAVAEYKKLGTPRLFHLMAEVEKAKKAGANREPPS